MAQTKSARDAAPTVMHGISSVGATSPQKSLGHVGRMARGLRGPTPDPTVSALDRLIARIETGTATPEDVDLLPDGVVEYLHAALTLSEMGLSVADWEVTPTGGILVRGPCP